MHEDRGLYAYTRQRQARGDSSQEIRDLDAAIDQVLDSARASGQLQPFLQVRDLVPLLAFTADAEPDRQEEFVSMLLRGLRDPAHRLHRLPGYRPPHPAPGG